MAQNTAIEICDGSLSASQIRIYTATQRYSENQRAQVIYNFRS